MTIVKAAKAALESAFSHHAIDVDPILVRATRAEFGDLQCNSIMAAAKRAGSNPRDLASSIAAAVDPSLFADVSVAGPGFINLSLKDSTIAAAATAQLLDPALLAERGGGERTVLDFGGPNVAKALHVGHLRSFVIGESLRRILLETGADVVSDIHLGDWGLQMGKLLVGVALEQGWNRDRDVVEAVSAADVSTATVDDLGRIYKLGNAACEDETVLSTARTLTALLQDGDPVLRAAWKAMRSTSVADVIRTAGVLGAHFDLLLGESDAHDEIGPMLEDLVSRAVVVESEGALVVPVAGDGLPENAPPVILRKSDGAALYATTDLATLRQRVRDLKARRIVYCTDDRQALQMAGVFSAARQAGYDDGAELVHVPFGTVRGPDGKPFKTRDGVAATLVDLLDAAMEKASSSLADPSSAPVVAIGALKFADLATPRRTGYVFDVEKMISFEGRTGPYLQYAYARIASMLDKAAVSGTLPAAEVSISCREERDLLVECLWYPESLASAARTYEPSEIAERAWLVADAFSRFYAACPVLQSEDPAARLATCSLVAKVIEKCLGLLGIGVVRRM
jgi:arginyl-tRNA synthetase